MKNKNVTGTLQYFQVLSYDEVIGFGYVVHYHKPSGECVQNHTISNIDGTPLQPGWFNFKILNQEEILVVVNRTIQ